MDKLIYMFASMAARRGDGHIEGKMMPREFLFLRYDLKAGANSFLVRL